MRRQELGRGVYSTGSWCCVDGAAPCSLLTNVGYISEAAASVVDRKLGLGIVPRTEVVSLVRT